MSRTRWPSSIQEAASLQKTELIATAHLHAQQVALDRGDPLWEPPPDADERFVLNMLRHRCTSYDQGQQTAEQRVRVNLLIAQQIPWLLAEAERQNGSRCEEDALQQAAADAYLEGQRQRATERRRWIRESKALLNSGQIRVGSIVQVRVRNHLRRVTVSAVLSPKVRVSYCLKNGEPREDLVYPSWCLLEAAVAVKAEPGPGQRR